MFILNQSETNDLGATVVLWSLSTALNILPRISFSITNIHKPTWPADGFHRSCISASRLPFFWPILLAQDRVSFSFWNSISWQSKCNHSLYQTRGKKDFNPHPMPMIERHYSHWTRWISMCTTRINWIDELIHKGTRVSQRHCHCRKGRMSLLNCNFAWTFYFRSW